MTMSRLSRIDDPISIMEELLNPYKGNMEMTPRVWEVGTKDNPTIVVRREMVEKKYKAWQEEDGSYHEELITDEEPIKAGLND
tara:strand:+ start:167 stop:415 length:249 start_codon:yes stop_codon:yes gene_type:complete